MEMNVFVMLTSYDSLLFLNCLGVIPVTFWKALMKELSDENPHISAALLTVMEGCSVNIFLACSIRYTRTISLKLWWNPSLKTRDK